jgi:hypothetical protein
MADTHNRHGILRRHEICGDSTNKNDCEAKAMNRECDMCEVSVPLNHGAHLEMDHMNTPGEFGWYCDDCAERIIADEIILVRFTLKREA